MKVSEYSEKERCAAEVLQQLGTVAFSSVV